MRLFAAGLLLLGVAAFSAGCGSEQTGIAKGGDISQGKQLFVAKCGSCHKLADAGTVGTIGPDLDGAFAADKAQHFKEQTIKQVVYDQIYHPAPAGAMPPKLVTGADATSVAAYVAAVAGTGSASNGAPPTLASPAAGGGGAGGGGGLVAQGAKLYEDLGCSSCHTLTGAKGIGPTYKGLYGSTVQLSTGQSVKADDAYLLESILDPDKQIVKGFPKGIMSASIPPGSVSEAKAKALVAFIKSKK
ncbi:MAG TPA: c-type cytochrome [Gaiellaceae bacterium]|nr:c-type cytochrome [Gaiellaceae bacterium]